MRYPGGKGKCFHKIINIFPPHETYIETHLGGGAVLRNKRAAAHSIGIDTDEHVVSYWRKNHPELAQFVHGDAVQFLRSYQFKGNELVYCDPPYVPSTRKRSRVYRHDLTEADHCILLDALVALPCRVVVSGYASILYESKLGHWQSISFAAKAHDGLREERVWWNYPIPARLHDMRYYGEDYRQRQNFKRRMERLRLRVARLTRPEQHQLNDWLSMQLKKGDAIDARIHLPERD